MLQIINQARLRKNEDDDNHVHKLGYCLLTKAIVCANNLKWPCGKIAELITCHQKLLLY